MHTVGEACEFCSALQCVLQCVLECVLQCVLQCVIKGRLTKFDNVFDECVWCACVYVRVWQCVCCSVC